MFVTTQTPYVLLVEDNPQDVFLIKRAWQRTSLPQDIHVVSDGDEALSYLAERCAAVDDENNLPDLVVLDLRMPTVDGYEVLRRIREDSRTCRLPVVVFTSVREPDSISKTYVMGATVYFVKPIGETNFNKTFKEIERFWTAYKRTLRGPQAGSDAGNTDGENGTEEKR